MAYEERPFRRQRIRYESDNDDNPVRFQLVIDGEKVEPTSATIAVTNPSGTEILAAVAMTKSGSIFTYSIDTTTTATWPVATSYRADIVVTYGGLTYDRHLVLDVERFLLHRDVGRDQVFGRDSGILGAEHGGDEDLSPLINAMYDEIQILIEEKAFADEQVMETMILDESRLSPCVRLYVLEAYWRGKNDELADHYERKFTRLWSAFLNAIKYDKSGDGVEDTDGGEIVTQRLMT